MKNFSIATMTVTVLVGLSAAHTFSSSACLEVSVKGDATYCIQGPICSGSGPKPAGSQCPVMGDVSSTDCHSNLPSYSSENACVLPVNATCQVIENGAWGCVLSLDESATNVTIHAEKANTVSNSISLSLEPTSSTNNMTGLLASIGAVAACVAAVAGFALYKQHKKSTAYLETFVDVLTP